MPPHFLAMVVAELRAVFARGSGLGAVVVSLVIGVGTVAVMFWVHGNIDG